MVLAALPLRNGWVNPKNLPLQTSSMLAVDGLIIACIAFLFLQGGLIGMHVMFA